MAHISSFSRKHTQFRANGRFTIELADGGPYGLHVYASGYIYSPEALKVENGKTLEVTVTLVPEPTRANDPVIKRVGFFPWEARQGRVTFVNLDVSDPNDDLGPQVMAFNAATGRVRAMAPPRPVRNLKANFPQGVKPPAVAVMAKVPGTAIVKSRLHTVLTPDQATALYRCFLLDRLDGLATVSDIEPVVAFTPPERYGEIAALVPVGFRCVPQQGRDLGERLAALLAALIAEGHTAAIAIDSDSPTLPMAYVAAAARFLIRKMADVVIGPADDGGYYLIGMTQPQPRLFEGVAWSTSSVLPTTLARAKELGLRCHLLPPWFDVDTESDLRRLRDQMKVDGGGPPRTFAFLRALYG